MTKDGWQDFAPKAKVGEDETACKRATKPTELKAFCTGRSALTKLEADYREIDESDPLQSFVNNPASNMFVTGIPDESTAVPVFCRRSFVDDICFGGQSFDKCLSTLDRLLVRFTESRIHISFTKSIHVQPQEDFLSHKVTAQSIAADPTKLVKLSGWSFPASKKGMQAFLGEIYNYSRFIQNIAVYCINSRKKISCQKQNWPERTHPSLRCSRKSTKLRSCVILT